MWAWLACSLPMCTHCTQPAASASVHKQSHPQPRLQCCRSTALLLAANAGEASAVRTLLALGADPAAANKDG